MKAAKRTMDPHAPWADPATADARNAEVVALMEREGCTGREAMEAVLFRHRMRLDACDGEDVERRRMQNGRCVIVRRATPFGHARDAISWRDRADIAAGGGAEGRRPEDERLAPADLAAALRRSGDD